MAQLLGLALVPSLDFFLLGSIFRRIFIRTRVLILAGREMDWNSALIPKDHGDQVFVFCDRSWMLLDRYDCASRAGFPVQYSTAEQNTTMHNLCHRRRRLWA